MSTLAVIQTGDNITINNAGDIIILNKTKNKVLYEEVGKHITSGDVKFIEENFQRIKDEIAIISKGLFDAKDKKIVLKGSDIEVPEPVLKKMQELESTQDMDSLGSLIRFWRKLEQNPSENSRKDLYTFILKNNIPITEIGDIVVEKGVNQKRGSFPGDLVDCHTGKINNSVGMEVWMPREEVNPDSNQTCSYGLIIVAHS